MGLRETSNPTRASQSQSQIRNHNHSRQRYGASPQGKDVCDYVVTPCCRNYSSRTVGVTSDRRIRSETPLIPTLPSRRSHGPPVHVCVAVASPSHVPQSPRQSRVHVTVPSPHVSLQALTDHSPQYRGVPPAMMNRLTSQLKGLYAKSYEGVPQMARTWTQSDDPYMEKRGRSTIKIR